jgi:hypothetical protein
MKQQVVYDQQPVFVLKCGGPAITISIAMKLRIVYSGEFNSGPEAE